MASVPNDMAGPDEKKFPIDSSDVQEGDLSENADQLKRHMVNNSIAEMTIFMPISGGFVRLAGKWVDESFGFMAGWNFFLYEASLIPFEITALNLVLTFWSDDIPVAAICAACVVLYACVQTVPYSIVSY